MKLTHSLVGAGAVAVGLVYAIGAWSIKSDAGYAGVGPNFLPWVVAIALLVCGGMLMLEGMGGGFLEMEEASGALHGHWGAFLWVSTGILLNAALITTIGFILSCALCFALAVRGFKEAAGTHEFSLKSSLVDLATGVAISAPVYWMFTKLLAIHLPGLTPTGWL